MPVNPRLVGYATLKNLKLGIQHSGKPKKWWGISRLSISGVLQTPTSYWSLRKFLVSCSGYWMWRNRALYTTLENSLKHAPWVPAIRPSYREIFSSMQRRRNSFCHITEKLQDVFTILWQLIWEQQKNVLLVVNLGDFLSICQWYD
jgi:hypothetical protein